MCTGRAYHTKAGGIVRSEPTVLICLCFRCGLKCVEAGAARDHGSSVARFKQA